MCRVNGCQLLLGNLFRCSESLHLTHRLVRDGTWHITLSNQWCEISCRSRRTLINRMRAARMTGGMLLS